MHETQQCWDSVGVGNTGAALLIVAATAGWLAAVAATAGKVRSKRAFATSLEQRGWLLERERETAAQNAVDGERARIARELHDIVSHNVSLMVIQAGAARQVLLSQPSDAAEALLAVEAAGRDAMTELRHLLGVLSPQADGLDEDRSPQPSLSRLTPLIDRIAFAGLPVEVRISGEPRALPPGIDLTAYRIIQESLTNALKHGDGVRAEVTVRYADRSLRVEVLNSGPSVLASARPTPAGQGEERRPGETPGRGLVGLRERVAVYGGELDARRRIGGGYRVRARIPLAAP